MPRRPQRLQPPAVPGASNGIAGPGSTRCSTWSGWPSVAGKRAGGFSLGMSQRLGIAAALLGDPPVLMFDEPVNGLDPEGVLWIRNLLKSLAAEGRTVFLSSHLMSEMALTADQLIVIGRGRLIAETHGRGLPERRRGNYVRVRSPAGRRSSRRCSRARCQRSSRQPDGTLSVTGAAADAVGELARGERHHACSNCRPQQASLEERYMELTSDSADYPPPVPRSPGRAASRPAMTAAAPRCPPTAGSRRLRAASSDRSSASSARSARPSGRCWRPWSFNVALGALALAIFLPGALSAPRTGRPSTRSGSASAACTCRRSPSACSACWSSPANTAPA